MKYLLKYMKNYRKEAILAPLFKMLEALFDLFVPLVMAALIDNGIANRDIPYIFRMCAILILLAVAGLAISITAQWFSAKAATGFAGDIRSRLFEHIQELSFSQMDIFGADTLITRAREVMEGANMPAIQLSVPLVVDAGKGKSWAAAH